MNERKIGILLIDDEYLTFFQRFKFGLSQYLNFDLFTADTKEKAVRILREKGEDKIDIVLLDIKLNGQDEGFEILKLIKEEMKSIPVIMFTRFSDQEHLMSAFAKEKYKADYYFTKNQIFEEGQYSNLKTKIDELLYSYGRIYNETGILITHGTDTMAWGFAILKYMLKLKDIKINIVITGSQIPLSKHYSPSDAIGNLKTAMIVLNRMRPPSISVVFNNGKSVFSANLQKVRKWDVDAFIGQQILKIDEGGEEILTEKVKLTPFKNQKLKTLYLIRTGGTIESEKIPGRGFVPTGDFVKGYLSEELKRDYFDEDLNPYPSLKKDSSVMILDDWFWVGEKIKEITKCEIDKNFDLKVKPVLCNPFLRTADYKQVFESASGIVLLGYGAGNANILENNEFSIMPALNCAKEVKKLVVVTSQVPMDDYDFEYETGGKLLYLDSENKSEFGAIPSGKLSFPEAQVKLSYLLGHQDIVKETAKKYKLDDYLLLKAAFLAGVEFRTEESKNTYFTEIMKDKIKPIDEDPFLFRSFEEAIELVAKRQLTAK